MHKIDIESMKQQEIKRLQEKEKELKEELRKVKYRKNLIKRS